MSQQEQVQRLSGTFTALPANVVSESTSETATSNENIVTAQHKPIKLPPDPPLRSDSRLSQVSLKVNIYWPNIWKMQLSGPHKKYQGKFTVDRLAATETSTT